MPRVKFDTAVTGHHALKRDNHHSRRCRGNSAEQITCAVFTSTSLWRLHAFILKIIHVKSETFL